MLSVVGLSCDEGLASKRNEFAVTSIEPSTNN